MLQIICYMNIVWSSIMSAKQLFMFLSNLVFPKNKQIMLKLIAIYSKEADWWFDPLGSINEIVLWLTSLLDL